MKKKLFVIDGHGLCYRAYYAFINNPLKNSKGQNTSAIFGFARMLFKLINDQNPDYLIVAFDPPKKSFRFGLFPEYKAKRQKMPDDLRPQIEEIKNMLSVMGILKIEHDDYEADDVLGTIASKYASDIVEVTLVTGDKDAYQLVNDNVRIYAGKKGITEFEIYDRGRIIDKLGLPPEQVIDYMALTGDTSDNIPGVKGIGEKTAQKLIKEYGSIDKLYDNIEGIQAPKLKNSLISEKETAYLSRDLVTIRKEVPVDIDLNSSKIPDFRTGKTKEYFSGLEMSSIVQELFPGQDPGSRRESEKKNYTIIKCIDDLKKIISIIREKGEVSVDTETTSLEHTDAELVGISLSINGQEGWYIPVFSEGLFNENKLDGPAFLELLKPMLDFPPFHYGMTGIKGD